MHHSEAFVALDTAKLRNAVAVAEDGRDGEVRYLGEVDNTEAATAKLAAKLAARYQRLTFCFEGPTGYGLYRLIKKLGHDCIVVAPSLIPSKPGDRVKTNRRDAVNLAKLADAQSGDYLRGGTPTSPRKPLPRSGFVLRPMHEPAPREGRLGRGRASLFWR